MDKLTSVMAYFCARYPHKDELSKARLTKMVYLADWRMALEHGDQITDIQWIFNHYGPYVHDVEDRAKESPLFKVRSTVNAYGSPAEIIQLVDDSGKPW